MKNICTNRNPVLLLAFALLALLGIFALFFLRAFPSLVWIKNAKVPAYNLQMSENLFYRQSYNNCGPYSVMAGVLWTMFTLSGKNTLLKIRESPSLSAKQIGRLVKAECATVIELGEDVTIDGIESAWVKVRIKDGAEGWCFAGYLTDGKEYREKPWKSAEKAGN